MSQEKTIQKEVSGFISSLVREHFGKGPTSVYVSVAQPFMTIHLRGCITPTEKILLKQNEKNHVFKIRDLIMDDLIGSIKLGIWKSVELDVNEVYADWNFENETGMIITILNEKEPRKALIWPDNIDKEQFRQEVIRVSIDGQKKPNSTEVFWLNDRTILIERTGIFVQIEKELIKNGFIEELKLAKRPLEYRLVRQSNLGSILQREIVETFVDWNFEEDKGYMVLMLNALQKDEHD